MKSAIQYFTLGVVATAKLLGTWALASGESDTAGDRATLPRQTGTHFFEVYHCGKLEGVVWVTPGEAALFRVQSLHSPQLRGAAFDIRAKAREQGTAFAVRGRKGGCTDA